MKTIGKNYPAFRKVMDVAARNKKDKQQAGLANAPRYGRPSNAMKLRVQEAIEQEARTRRNIEALERENDE